MGLAEGLEIRTEPDRSEACGLCRRSADLGNVRIADHAVGSFCQSSTMRCTTMNNQLCLQVFRRQNDL